MTTNTHHSRAGRAITACLNSDVPSLRAAACELIYAQFRAHHGNLQRCADELGIPVRTLFRWAKDHTDVGNALDSARRA